MSSVLRETGSGSHRLLRLFAAQVDRVPDNRAAVCADQEWSYREVDHRSSRQAHLLIGLGVRPGRTVGPGAATFDSTITQSIGRRARYVPTMGHGECSPVTSTMHMASWSVNARWLRPGRSGAKVSLFRCCSERACSQDRAPVGRKRRIESCRCWGVVRRTARPGR
ncbi:AMP-binding protein [Nocardia beijingensis]|uniref:AMP-binding protein n=1 Tax=Nocardia beijingensis TaxID=95162 RepID=UPI003A5CD488